MTDADIQNYVADNQGYTSNNPFRKLPYDDNDEPMEFDRDYIDEDPDEEFYEEDNTLDMLSDGDDIDYDYPTDY